MSDESLAEKVNTEVPWWAKAPVWLAAGIVGVPSLMAIGAGYFIAGNVTKHLAAIRETNVSEMQKLDRIMDTQERYWEQVRRTIGATLEVQVRTCIHDAKDQKERDDCIKGITR